jgi:hypothetical protein
MAPNIVIKYLLIAVLYKPTVHGNGNVTFLNRMTGMGMQKKLIYINKYLNHSDYRAQIDYIVRLLLFS